MSKKRTYDERLEEIKKIELVYPIFVKNKKGTSYFCFDDEYRFMRLDLCDTKTQTMNTLQYGYNYGYGKSKYTDQQKENEELFIRKMINLGEKITADEFFIAIKEQYEQKLQDYQRFALELWDRNKAIREVNDKEYEIEVKKTEEIESLPQLPPELEFSFDEIDNDDE